MARGIELATTYVTVAVETSDVAKTIGASLGNVERKVAPKAGKAIGRSMAKGFEAEAPDLSRLEDEFKRAQERIVAAEEKATTEQENLARKVEIAQRKKEEAVQKYGDEASQALVAVDRLKLAEQKLEGATMKAEAEQSKLNDELERADSRLQEARKSTEKMTDSVEDADSKWGNLGGAIKRALDGDFKGAFADLGRGAEQSAGSITDSFDGIGGKAGGKFNGAFVGALKLVGGLVAAAGIGKIISDAIVDGMEDEKAADKIQASLGLTEEAAASSMDSVREIYAQGWGESTGEVQTAVEALLSANPSFKSDNKALEETTGQVLALAEAFGTDVPLAAQIATQLVQNKLAPDMQSALDMMAAGFQQVPVSLRDEYTDALEEYTPHLANLGYTGEEAFKILASSSQLGKYGIDKAGDAMKEFSIRASDGSAASTEAFEIIGLDAEKMASMVAEGGEAAREATEMTIDGLLGIEDPAVRAQTAIALFGTPLEDLSVAEIPNFLKALGSADEGLGDVEGAAQGIADTLGGNLATRVEQSKRKFENLKAEVGERLIGAFYAVHDWVSEKLGPVFEWLGTNVIEPVGEVFADFAGYIVDTFGPSVGNVVGALVDFIAALWTNILSPVLSALWGFIKDVLGPIFEWLWESVVKPVWGFISGAITTAWDIISVAFDALTYGIEHVGGVFSWLYDNVVSPVWDWISDKISKAWDKIRPVFNALTDFLSKTLGPAFTSFRDVAVGAFESLANLLLAPVQFIVNTVYNDGIKKVFDAVAQAVGSDVRLPAAHISDVSFSRKSGGGGAGGGAGVGRSMTFNARARGGWTPPGWTLVGEEGPELVNFTAPNRVYTAEETRAVFDVPSNPDRRFYDRLAGSSPSQALAPMGGESVADRIGAAWSKTWRGALEVVTDIGGRAVTFTRGVLASTAEAVLNPLRATMGQTLGRAGTIGSISNSVINRAIDAVLDWVRGHDDQDRAELEKAELALGAGVSTWSAMLGALMGDIPSGGGASRPVAAGRLTSLFGPRWGGHHAGVDFAVPVGTPVRAWRSGRVIAAGWNALAGRTGIGAALAHAGGLGSYYGHNSRLLVGPGDTVRAGQVIALSGNTGRSTGPHLHFEISRGNNPHNVVNPLPFLYDNGGWLQPGVSLVENKTRKPEPVLTHGQWSTLERAVGERSGLPPTVTLVDADGSLLGRMRVVVDEAFEREVAWA